MAKIDIREIGKDVLPALGTIAGLKLPEEVIDAVGDAVTNAQALDHLTGAEKKAEAAKQIQEVAKDVLQDILPGGVMDTLIQLGWIKMKVG